MLQSTVNGLLRCRHPAWFFIIWWYLKSVYTDHHTNCTVLSYILLSSTSVDQMKELRCPTSNRKEQEDGREEQRCRKANYYQSMGVKAHGPFTPSNLCSNLNCIVAPWMSSYSVCISSPFRGGTSTCGPLSCPKPFLGPWSATPLSYLSFSNFHSKISIPLGPLNIFPTGT